MATIQIVSDLHLEAPKGYDIFEIVPRAPHLALLGDIGNVATHKDELLGFLTRQLQQFRTVLFVPGNHEAYHSSWAETLAILRDFQDRVREGLSASEGSGSGSGEFILMDRTAFRISESTTVIENPTGVKAVVVLGCSLFSHVPVHQEMAVSIGLNDFFHTDEGHWDVAAHNAAHARDLAWLNEQVAALEREAETSGPLDIVILSHWSPTRDVRAADPKHGTDSPIASGFSTDLSRERCFSSSRVKVWAFGHTHYNCDFFVERAASGVEGMPLRLVANQRGYYFNQADGFDGEKTIEV
ncbi:Metallo-dependent phosphatase-like protein [Dichotomopilus funicola]|uniref:Metallo-dependent phosphatase-like protein n=1 Tax=Dichotomopilus funicola TaxID=1934379 RepID=A0AAN6ZR08_9PEZI|nr:Metallo-dependent phosphatase-like protein [Dichotomopilus funicola]